jgi:transposase-like protein
VEQKKKAKRVFSPEQKLNILQQIETSIKSGLSTMAAVEKHGIAYSVYSKWKRQLAVGVKSSLRNGKAPVDKEKKRLERENERLKAIVLSQAQAIADLKKETNWE